MTRDIEQIRIVKNTIEIIKNVMNGIDVVLPSSIYKESIDWLEKQIPASEVEPKQWLSPWSEGVLSMGDDKTFLKLVWRYDIESLKTLVNKTTEDLKLCKNSQKSGGVLRSIWIKDKFNLEFRLKCLNQIIKSKQENPDYIPETYK